MFGKMDPFVELEIAGFSLKKTSVNEDAGQNPVWDDPPFEYPLKAKDRSALVNIKVSDEDVTENEVIAEAKGINISRFC